MICTREILLSESFSGVSFVFHVFWKWEKSAFVRYLGCILSNWNRVYVFVGLYLSNVCAIISDGNHSFSKANILDIRLFKHYFLVPFHWVCVLLSQYVLQLLSFRKFVPCHVCRPVSLPTQTWPQPATLYRYSCQRNFIYFRCYIFYIRNGLLHYMSLWPKIPFSVLET